MQGRHTTPNGGVDVLDDFGGGHTVFIEFATVAEDVFGNVTEVDVEFSWVVLVFLFREGVHQPEFQILDVGGLKVGGLHLAHDTCPTALWCNEFALGIDTM